MDRDKREVIKKQRKVLRTAFTRAFNTFTSKMENNGVRDEKIMAFQFLEAKMTELDVVHSAYNQALFNSEMNEVHINKELESDVSYKTQYLMQSK